ncbi:GNAT family N-acetyltransferase [Flexivirga alba]|uniref:GNAT family N-acetyltransferase n=1 Tax=Flexivirga alba TaxID=702742 RepID=A0ABW2AKM3_9MICO
MAALESLAGWPPAPIGTRRLVLREPEARDRSVMIELLSSAEVGQYVGGAQPRDELEKAMPREPRRRPGLFVVEQAGSMIGAVTLERRDPERLGHLYAEGGELELGYLFLPRSWGSGYATEACAAVLEWCAGAFPDQPVVLSTQTANAGSLRVAEKLGFTEVERFEDYGAEQWLGALRPVTRSRWMS